jgi:hypothetical protein
VSAPLAVPLKDAGLPWATVVFTGPDVIRAQGSEPIQ